MLSARCPAGSSSPQYMAVCYYGTWAVYRPGLGKFDIEDFNPYLCTHGIYAFAGLDQGSSKIKSLDPWNDLYDNYGKGEVSTRMLHSLPAFCANVRALSLVVFGCPIIL